MSKRHVMALCLGVLLSGAGMAAAQSGTAETKSDKMTGTSTSMTGCVEAGPASTYMLTHVDPLDALAKGKMSAAKMAADKALMDKDQMGHIPDKTTLLGTAVDLSKHVGHKVTVKGRKDADGMTVTSIKMVAPSCP